jgi:hypothetical protein
MEARLLGRCEQQVVEVVGLDLFTVGHLYDVPVPAGPGLGTLEGSGDVQQGRVPVIDVPRRLTLAVLGIVRARADSGGVA